MRVGTGYISHRTEETLSVPFGNARLEASPSVFRGEAVKGATLIGQLVTFAPPCGERRRIEQKCSLRIDISVIGTPRESPDILDGVGRAAGWLFME